MTRRRTNNSPRRLQKAPSGITGLDEITLGGLPRGRSTLIAGGTGCGKTMMAMEFLVRGARQYDEPGVFMAFEERPDELAKNFTSLGYDLDKLRAENKLLVEFVRIDRGEIEETGDYDLEALFIRLGHAIDTIGAKRVVLDTIESLFSGLSNTAILRAELQRLFRWLTDKGVTSIITGERGEMSITRHGLEEYVADCVITLEHRVSGGVATRRLRVVKYRGSTHGTNEYPFLLDEGGIWVLPITSVGLSHPASTERVSTGIPRLDEMLEGKGVYRGSSVLVSGTAGSGKTSLAAHFIEAAAKRGKKCMWFAFEESPDQICRNMLSIGLDLQAAVKQGKLTFDTWRPDAFGLEMHLALILRRVKEFKPDVIVLDPITNFSSLGTDFEIKAYLTRLIDHFKSGQITALYTSLASDRPSADSGEIGVSSLMDTWISLSDAETGAERNRLIYLLKSRGMAHSNQVREFKLTSHGIEILDVYLGPTGGLLVGSSRVIVEAQEEAARIRVQQEAQKLAREIKRKGRLLDAQIVSLRTAFEAEEEELTALMQQGAARSLAELDERQRMARSRGVATQVPPPKGRKNGGRR